MRPIPIGFDLNTRRHGDVRTRGIARFQFMQALRHADNVIVDAAYHKANRPLTVDPEVTLFIEKF